MIQVLPRQMDSLAALVAMVRDFLRAESLPERRACDLDLVLEELFANIVRHGRGTGGVQVELSPAPEGVRIVLRADEPEAFDPTVSPGVDEGASPEEGLAGGLGLQLVRRRSREFTYDWSAGAGTTTVLMGVSE